MKCKFCDAECKNDRHMRKCDNHGSLEVIFYVNQLLQDKIYLQSIRSSKFLAHTYFMLLDSGSDKSFYLYKVNHRNENWVEPGWLAHVECDPDITPSNFENKVKTILTFL